MREIDYKEISEIWNKSRPTGRQGGKSVWLAIKRAIEKQVPKKPTDIRSLNNGKLQIGLCPVCKDGNNSECRYCSNCGKRLAWW